MRINAKGHQQVAISIVSRLIVVVVVVDLKA